MFFSRLHKNLKRQDWFTVGLEFLAVVFGVYLALQAENWNEWRKERVQEQQFLQRLHEAIVESNATMRFAIDYMGEHARMAGVVMKSLDACQIAAADRRDVANGLYQLGTVVPPYLPEGVFNELRIAGKADIIRSEAIRNSISTAVTGYDYYMSFHDDVVDRITPQAIYVGNHVVFHIDPEVGAKQFIEWDETTFDISTVCDDSRFKAAIAGVRRLTYEVIKWNELALHRHERLAETLASELKQVN